MTKRTSRITSQSRRDLLRRSALAAMGGSMSGWLPRLAADTVDHPNRKRSVILLWMSGGPSQIDTLDPKPDHENGGEFKPISTATAGIQLCEHLPKLAKLMPHLALVRSMSTKEGDHSRGAYLMRTGNPPQGPVHYPTLGSLLSKELGAESESDLPDFVSISPYRLLNPAAFGAGFLGPKYAPLVIGGGGGGQDYQEALKVRNLDRPDEVPVAQADERLRLLSEFEAGNVSRRPSPFSVSHDTARQQAVRMMRSSAVEAFSLDDEPAKLRDAYGRNTFGQGCLMARRLVEQGVPFVEVSLNGVAGQVNLGWDTHRNNFGRVKALCEVLDGGWATLISDLKSRGLLESTLIIWMGEFGRTPRINGSGGRDHFPVAWSTALAGGGIRGGQVIGETTKDGTSVKDRPVQVADLISTICHAVGIDPKKQNNSNVGRPIRIADPSAKPLKEILQ